jgi:hypothetical protein
VQARALVRIDRDLRRQGHRQWQSLRQADLEACYLRHRRQDPNAAGTVRALLRFGQERSLLPATPLPVTRVATLAKTRAASGGPAGELGPVLAEASALPSQDGVGRDDDQRSGQPDPEQAVGRAQLRPERHSLVDGELLAQGQVLEGELAMVADEEGEEPQQVE